MSTVSTTLTEQLDHLNRSSTQELQAEWRRLCRSEPPRVSRDVLIRALAYRLQELSLGGMSKTTQRRLAALAKSIGNTGEAFPHQAGTGLDLGRLVAGWPTALEARAPSPKKRGPDQCAPVIACATFVSEG